MSALRLTRSLALAASLPALILCVAVAAEPKDQTGVKPKPEVQDSNTKDKDDAKDRFALPEGGVKELIAFVKELRLSRPKTAAEAVEFRAKVGPAMKAAVAKAQEIATDEDKKLEGYNDLVALSLALRAEEVRNASPESQNQLIADVKAYLANVPNPAQEALVAVNRLAMGQEFGGDRERAAALYREFGAILAKSSDERTAKQGTKMEGAARRLALLGNPLELQGTTMDGKKFDLTQLRGKVVLVDFWATWCGPCRAESPNVKKNYDLYHDRGFDVVGVSLDDDRDALEKYLEKENHPWLNLHDGGWDANATATYYGIMGIPTVILVDKSGNVVSTNARGPELGKQLATLLGPAEPAEKAAEEAAK